jgi:hypothetical protein
MPNIGDNVYFNGYWQGIVERIYCGTITYKRRCGYETERLVIKRNEISDFTFVEEAL